MATRRELPDTDNTVQDLPLHLKYRPQTLKEVLGQDGVTESLHSVLKAKNPGHAYLFTGPAGTGKTTLARILAKRFNCDAGSILEVDAASNSGIDAMRDVTAALRYHGFGDTPNKGIIIDECHSLSKQAWQSLLKTVEEPPPHVYIFFCTTESGKVPETIVSRCHSYALRRLRYDDIMDLLDSVIEEERMLTPKDIVQLVAGACEGSARKALVMLSMVRDCRDFDEAATLLESPTENKEVIDLCRLLVGGKLDWTRLTATLQAMPEMPPESIRIVIANYLAACLMGAKSERDAVRLLNISDSFARPFVSSDKNLPLLLAFGDHIFKD